MKKREFIKLKLERLLSSPEEDVFISSLVRSRVRENWMLLQLDFTEHKLRKKKTQRRLVLERIHLITEAAVPKTQVLEWENFCLENGKRLEITCWCAATKGARLLQIPEFVDKIYDKASTHTFKVFKRASKQPRKEAWNLRLTSYEVGKRTGKTSFFCTLTK